MTPEWEQIYEREERRNRRQAKLHEELRRSHVICLQYTPSRRLAATTRGVTVLGPRLSFRAYQKISAADLEHRKKIVLLLFHQYLMKQKTAPLCYRRCRKPVYMDGKIVGYRLNQTTAKEWGGYCARELHLLFQDIFQVRVVRCRVTRGKGAK